MIFGLNLTTIHVIIFISRTKLEPFLACAKLVILFVPDPAFVIGLPGKS